MRASFTKKFTPMVWFTILLVIACGLALGLPPDPHTLQQLNISSLTYRLVILLLLVPYAVIWYAAFFAFGRLKNYAAAIKRSKDGQAFRQVMIGMGVLAFGLVIPTIVSLILNNIALHSNGFKPAATIIANYVTLLAVLIAFWFMGQGAHRLVESTKARITLGGLRWLAILLIFIGIFFTYLVFRNHFTSEDTYYLETYPLIITIIAPYIFVWFMAFFCAYEFNLYAIHVKGLIYRRALRQFAIGIVVTIAGSVASQFVNNTLAASVSHSLGWLLVVAYILLAIILTGLLMMAQGAKKLSKIEEI